MSRACLAQHYLQLYNHKHVVTRAKFFSYLETILLFPLPLLTSVTTATTVTCLLIFLMKKNLGFLACVSQLFYEHTNFHEIWYGHHSNITYFSRSMSHSPHEVHIIHVNLPQKDVEYLGLHLNRRLTWCKHIFTKRKQLMTPKCTGYLDGSQNFP
jgi:hypothetical protein